MFSLSQLLYLGQSTPSGVVHFSHQQHPLHRPLSQPPVRVPRSRKQHVQPRVVPLAAAEHHHDLPTQQGRAKWNELREEDILELESFLRYFQQHRSSWQGCQKGSLFSEDDTAPGEVHLVGTGPGDPGLLTLRAVQLMQTADVVLYDRLVSDDILRLVGPQARMVYVGKHSGFHTRSQEEIHQLLLAFAEAGACVIRLKSGDPYVFGRGGEEMAYLSAQGINVQCVPGITAASGICAELGIPMTHRGVATSVRFLTGHARDGGEQELLDSTVAGAADPHTTLVVYMGLQSLPNLYNQLQLHGMQSDIPAVAIERGTTRRQRIVWGNVGELAARAQEAALKSPVLIIIGQVVALAAGWQQWQAAGQPLVWKEGQLPAHSYAIPSIDNVQLQQAGRMLTARMNSHSCTSSSSGGLRGNGHAATSKAKAPVLMGSPSAVTSPLAAPAAQLSTQACHEALANSTRSASSSVSTNSSHTHARHPSSSSQQPNCGDADTACELPNLPPLQPAYGGSGSASDSRSRSSPEYTSRSDSEGDEGSSGSDGHDGQDRLKQHQGRQQQVQHYTPGQFFPSCGGEDTACELPNLPPLLSSQQQQQQQQAIEGSESGEEGFVPICGGEDMACELPNLPPLPSHQQQQQPQHAPHSGSHSDSEQFSRNCGGEDMACELSNLPPLLQ